ncbi:hypothetical protein HYT54_04935 [Candidatus Woesearchaeota archaeon]|nr:hypothetical protein [Candidatus Woesearchaeota archaeon]
MAKARKSVYFTIDALLSASLLAIGVLLLSSSYISETTPPSNNYFAGDFLAVLSNLKVREANSSSISEMIVSGDITKLNNSILEQIGELWAEGNEAEARNITQEFIGLYLPENIGIGFYIDDEPVYVREKTNYNSVTSRRRLVSGIQKNRTTDGFVARAIAIRTRKNNSLVVPGDVITSAVEKSPSGNNQNQVNITYDVYIPDNTTLLGSRWFIEAAWSGIRFDAYLNGQFVGSSSPSDNGQKNFNDLNAYLGKGHNNASVLFKFGNANNPEGGDDGASHFVVNYTTTAVNTLGNLNKKYLALVNSNASVRYKKPIFVAGNINSINIYLNVTAQNVSLNYTLDGNNYFISKKNASSGNLTWSNDEIVSALASNGHSLSSLNNKYFWFVFDIDTYNARETKGPGRQVRKNSYVEIDATSTIGNIYGMIDVTKLVPVYSYQTQCSGGFSDFYRNLSWRFNVSNYTIPFMTDSQLAWLYLTGTDPSQVAKANQNVLYQHPASPLIREFARFGYTNEGSYFVNGINNYSLVFGSGYCIDPRYSLVTHTFLLNNFVGYGGTFSSLAGAKDDAEQRLDDKLGDFVNAVEISSDVIVLSRIPSMWGPSVMEIRIWQ